MGFGDWRLGIGALLASDQGASEVGARGLGFEVFFEGSALPRDVCSRFGVCDLLFRVLLKSPPSPVRHNPSEGLVNCFFTLLIRRCKQIRSSPFRRPPDPPSRGSAPRLCERDILVACQQCSLLPTGSWQPHQPAKHERKSGTFRNRSGCSKRRERSYLWAYACTSIETRVRT